jgi:hypothetical protein
MASMIEKNLSLYEIQSASLANKINQGQLFEYDISFILNDIYCKFIFNVSESIYYK